MTSMKEFIKLSPINMLSINYCKLGDVGGVAIGEAIEMTKNLKDLRAKKNDFRDKTAKEFAKAFEKPTCKLERVDLSNNMINDSGGELIGLSIAENEHL